MSTYPSSVVITGASQGIGRNIAVAFASETEHPLLLIARNRDRLEETRRLCLQKGANKAELIICDTTDPRQVEDIQIPEGFPHPGIIINNAGSFLYKKLADTSHSEFQEQINTNLFSAVHIVSRFLDTLKEIPRALIVNICSVSATHGLLESGAYSASKHALLGYTRSLRKELRQANIAVTAINLGQTFSPSWDGSDVDRSLLINPDDVAALILSLSKLSPATVVEEILIQPQHGRVPPM